jgi:hypothetical protein
MSGPNVFSLPVFWRQAVSSRGKLVFFNKILDVYVVKFRIAREKESPQNRS